MGCLGSARHTHRRGPVLTHRRAVVAGCCVATAWRCDGLLGGEAAAFVSANGPRLQRQPAVVKELHPSAGIVQHSRVPRSFFDTQSSQPEVKPIEDVVIKEDYRLAGIFAVLGAVLCAVLPYAGFGLGALTLLLAILFFVQTGRVRFVFNRETFELKTLGTGPDLQEPGENVVVGGENRWTYKSFVNYEFFPKGLVEKGLPPVLVYFKETQTPSSEWSVGPGAAANSEDALARGARPGMVHFFPAICDTQQIKAEFEKRGCAKITEPSSS
mmetsp:Transcript_10633/g.20609  ORF Transcript_10633/g.20609 Transcript_10633/m.20609 type:complete len:270 (+) Transcript_10633:66-875(+)